MYINTTGLVLRETRYKDSGKILTVLTGSEGKLTVSARGALRKGSRLAAVTQILAYSELTLSQYRDRWTLTEGQSVELFMGLREDLDRLSLGSYFAEVTEAAADEDSPNPELLALCLNALFALSSGDYGKELIKAAFELRLLALSGFAPLLSHCAVCGEQSAERAFLDVAGGTLRCGDCIQPDVKGFIELHAGTLQAMRYITSCESKKLFAFTLGVAARKNLAVAAEEYLLAQLDRRFRTLEYYKSVVG